jgi:hypothetical protein
VVIAQQTPASWRATATATIVLRLPRWSSRRRQPVQSLLGGPGDREHGCRLALLAALERCAGARRAAVVPGGLDQQPPGVAGAGLGDRSLLACLPGAAFGGDEPQVAHQLAGALEAGEVADLGAQPDRRQRVDAAQAAQPRHLLRPGAGGDEPVDHPLERVAAKQQRLDRAQVVVQRRLRRRLAERDPGQPGAVGGRPAARPVLVADVVSQQQLAQPVPGAHQVDADVLARPDEVAQRLLLAARHAHRVQTVDHQQPHQPLGVAAVGLDAVLGGPLDLPGRRNDAVDPVRRQRPRQREPGRAGLIGDTGGSRQAAAERRHLARPADQTTHAQLTRRRIDNTSDRRRRVHVQTDPSANLGHGRFLLLDCGRRASTSRAATTSPTASGDRPCLPTAADVTLHTVFAGTRTGGAGALQERLSLLPRVRVPGRSVRVRSSSWRRPRDSSFLL